MIRWTEITEERNAQKITKEFFSAASAAILMDENVLFLFTREFIHSKMLNHWLRGVYRRTEQTYHLLLLTKFCIQFSFRSPTQTQNVFCLVCKHAHAQIHKKYANWLNEESYADLFIWINQLNYLLRLIRHTENIGKSQSTEQNDITHTTQYQAKMKLLFAFLFYYSQFDWKRQYSFLVLLTSIHSICYAIRPEHVHTNLLFVSHSELMVNDNFRFELDRLLIHIRIKRWKIYPKTHSTLMTQFIFYVNSRGLLSVYFFPSTFTFGQIALIIYI